MTADIQRIKDLSRHLAALLTTAGVPTPMLDARLLTAHALGLDGQQVLACRDRSVTAAQIAVACALSGRRAAGEPVSRITGMREFWSLPFRLSEATLDPRADSETLITAALQLFHGRQPPAQIVDLGTGSGCLLLALLTEWPSSFGIGVDMSQSAVRTATANAAALGLAERARMQVGNWLEGFGAGEFAGIDLLLANPPYIPAAVVETLAIEVRDHDPRAALDGGMDGLDAYRAIAGQLSAAYRQTHKLPPWIILEIGHDQAADVTAIMATAGYRLFKKQLDYGDNDRCLVLTRDEDDGMT